MQHQVPITTRTTSVTEMDQKGIWKRQKETCHILVTSTYQEILLSHQILRPEVAPAV